MKEDIFKLIVGNVENKNPINDNGKTPKNLADQNGHVQISKLFES